VVGVPYRDQIVAALADVLAAHDIALEGACRIEMSFDVGIRAVADVDRALQVNGGGVGAQSFELDRLAAQVEEDDRIAQFDQHLANRALVQSRTAGDELYQVVQFGALAQFDIGHIGVDGFYSTCHWGLLDRLVGRMTLLQMRGNLVYFSSGLLSGRPGSNAARMASSINCP